MLRILYHILGIMATQTYLLLSHVTHPQWSEIKRELLHSQTPVDRHDITARVFKQKLKSLMNS